MKQILTANNLFSGEVIYLKSKKKWVDNPDEATVFDNQEESDKALERENEEAKKLEDAEERKGIVSEVFEGVKDALKEVNYAKKYGGKKYLEAKKEEDPDHPMFDTPTEKIKDIK